ncbi:hypothetical protein MTX80_15680 [Gordonia amicalis]|nr:hypothetical protein [Gordonia amicalis]UOG20562.1 hypothetical protein MTX80_15680 [Gordonia amicalis]
MPPLSGTFSVAAGAGAAAGAGCPGAAAGCWVAAGPTRPCCWGACAEPKFTTVGCAADAVSLRSLTTMPTTPMVTTIAEITAATPADASTVGMLTPPERFSEPASGSWVSPTYPGSW